MKTPKIVINIGSQRDGYTLRPKPTTRVWFEKNYPDKERVASVFIGFDKTQDLQQIADSVWNRVWPLLTGLSVNELNQIGGLVVVDPVTKQEVYRSMPAYV